MSSSDPYDPLRRHTRRLTWQARAMLCWEQYAPVFALAGICSGIYLIAAFSGIWERVGDPWRLVVLTASLIVLGWASYRASKYKLPTQSQARRRVEQDSGAIHRPLDVLDDKPALGAESWSSHYKKAVNAATGLKAPKGRPTLSLRDPYFIRYVLPVGLGLAMMVGAGDNFERLRRSLVPSWQAGLSAEDVKFEVWADPPNYTGRPPIYFRDADQIDVPHGSKLVARVTGAKSPPRLKISTNRGSKYLPLERLGPDSFEASTTVTSTLQARWRIGNSSETWQIKALEDQPPTVNVEESPEADKRDRLSITYSFEDDYGVEEIFLIMNLHTDDEIKAKEISRVDIPVTGSVKEASKKTSAINLTKHKWAGQKVAARLYVRDGAQQSAGSGYVYFVVPDKIFIEPLAKAVIEHRNLVMSTKDKTYASEPEYTRFDYQDMPYFDTYEPDQRLDRAPVEIQRAAVLIEAVTDQPESLFRDPAVFMGLKNIENRLRYAREMSDLSGISEDLWSIAIRAEFGVLGNALEEMQEAERALRDGMARRAPQREIDTLFERYNEAVDRYMEELRQKAIEDGNIAEGPQSGGGGQNVDQIQELLEAIEEANRIGDTEGARLALAKLAELLENMQIQLSASGGGEGGEPMEGEMSEEMKEVLEELADLLGEQRELQDETRQAENEAQQDGEQGQDGQSGESQSGSAPQPGGDQQSGSQEGGNQDGGSENGNSRLGAKGDRILSPQELAERQDRLAQALETLRENAPDAEGNVGVEDENGDRSGGGDEDSDEDGTGGSASDALDEAARAMENSLDALGQGLFGDADSAQADAIRALRRAGEALAEQAASERDQNGQEAGSANNDPLGRNSGGVNDENSEADIEQRDNATRSREILEELRRRASEQDRQKLERDYLERLLNRF